MGVATRDRRRFTAGLVIDDVGAEGATPHAVGVFYDIVEGRYNRDRWTVFTSNYSEAEMTNRLAAVGDSISAERIMRRVQEKSLEIKL